MIALAIVIAALLLIALLRFGVFLEYGSEGVIVKLLVGPLVLKVFPSKEKPDEKERKARKKAKKELKKEKDKDKQKKQLPGGLQTFLDMIPPLINMLSRIKRRLLINNLTVHFVVAGTDASKTAMTYGVVNAALGSLASFLDNNFRVKHRDFHVDVDFLSEQQTVYARASFSLAVWESLYIVFALFPIIKIFFKPQKTPKAATRGSSNSKSEAEINTD
ncbi:MAG: DUF2953 domain-containing protein [Oscillospiraceae bacterium]|nr:DUF2953 domain-containing protein [Oscillospiraceae bacterium]